jgi:hypothetical protein
MLEQVAVSGDDRVCASKVVKCGRPVDGFGELGGLLAMFSL